MNFDTEKLFWTRPPEQYRISPERIEITTQPHTDLWQHTYYHFRNDSAPVLQMETAEPYFSFVVRTDFTDSKHRFDQCGIVLYLDSENWLKASVEYENGAFHHLGSVVTNEGYSDWATTDLDGSVRTMWYRLSRREDDYRIECSQDGNTFHQMRICHMRKGGGVIRFGLYACSPEDSSFTAVFSQMRVTECQWQAHDGQQPDREAEQLCGGAGRDRTMRVLMLGNSFTFTNDMPRTLAELTGAEVVHHTRGGAQLSEHLNSKTQLGDRTQEALRNEHWDYVVLQEMSHGPITAPKSFFSSVERLCRQIRDNGAIPILYATWPYQKGGAKLAAKGWDYDEMARKLFAAYHRAAQENHALVADVGQRFYQLSDSQNLYADDGIHPNEQGSRIAAETLAAVIRGCQEEQP